VGLMMVVVLRHCQVLLIDVTFVGVGGVLDGLDGLVDAGIRAVLVMLVLKSLSKLLLRELTVTC
jgi:hypothetical protein